MTSSLLESKEFSVFFEIPCKSSTSWKPLILGYAIQGLIGGVMKLIYPILEPDPVSWNNIIAGLADNASPHGMQFVSRCT